MGSSNVKVERRRDAVTVPVRRAVAEGSAVMKPTLRSEDRRDLESFRQLQKSIGRKCMGIGQIRRSTIEIGAVIVFPRLRHRVTVTGHKSPIHIGLAGYRICHYRRNSNEA